MVLMKPNSFVFFATLVSFQEQCVLLDPNFQNLARAEFTSLSSTGTYLRRIFEYLRRIAQMTTIHSC